MKRRRVVHDLQEVATLRAAIDGLPDGVLPRASGRALKDRAVLGHATTSFSSVSSCMTTRWKSASDRLI